ncbi:MAG: DUF1330 domain-containing protein [Lachnospiraceae bacterium]|nr:DUF1330 domain-containing protein [Lachnospiraceae bacterium]
MVYFIACIKTDINGKPQRYQEYIREVEPIVKRFGGRYMVRSDRVTNLSEDWKPDRVIIIEWDSREQLEQCFRSEEYQKIAGKRENSVDSKAIIVEGSYYEGNGTGISDTD